MSSLLLYNGWMLEITVREGSSGDEDILVQLFDDAVVGLLARGQVGQWGSEPFSRRTDAREQV